jgi:hypothetical protein
MAGSFVSTLDFTKIFIFILLVSVAQVEIIPQLCIIVVQDYGIYCNKRYMLFAALNSAVIQKMKR